MIEKRPVDLLDAFNNSGSMVEKRKGMQFLADTVKSFAHFRF